MALTFQVPLQYCSLQHWALLLSPVTSATGCCFCFGSVSSFFLELFLHWSLVAYWAPTDLGSSSFSVLSFCFFILFMGFSRQEYWSGLPFSSPVDHILSELSTMPCPCWVALQGMWSDWLVFCDCDFHFVCPLIEKDKRLWKLPDGRDWLRGKLGLVLMGGAMLSKSLIQFSVDWWSWVPSLLFTWGQTMVEVVKIMVTSFKRSHGCTVTLSAPNPAVGHHWPTPPLEIPGRSWASLGRSLVGSLLLCPGSWCTQCSVCALQESISQSCVSSWSSMVGLMATSFKRAYAIPKSAAPRAPGPMAVHCWPVPPQEMLKHSSVLVSVGSLGPDAHKVCLNPLSVSGRNGVRF